MQRKRRGSVVKSSKADSSISERLSLLSSPIPSDLEAKSLSLEAYENELKKLEDDYENKKIIDRLELLRAPVNEEFFDIDSESELEQSYHELDSKLVNNKNAKLSDFEKEKKEEAILDFSPLKPLFATLLISSSIALILLTLPLFSTSFSNFITSNVYKAPFLEGLNAASNYLTPFYIIFLLLFLFALYLAIRRKIKHKFSFFLALPQDNPILEFLKQKPQTIQEKKSSYALFFVILLAAGLGLFFLYDFKLTGLAVQNESLAIEVNNVLFNVPINDTAELIVNDVISKLKVTKLGAGSSLTVKELSNMQPPPALSFKKVFSMDYDLEFESASFSYNDQGYLYKCTLFDSSSDSCLGIWQYVKDISGEFEEPLFKTAFAIAVNYTLNETSSNFTETNNTIQNETLENIIVSNETAQNITINATLAPLSNITNITPQNETNVTIPQSSFEKANITELLQQYQVVIRKPVKWSKKITVDATAENITTELPSAATNISVRKNNQVLSIEELSPNSITGFAVAEEPQVKVESNQENISLTIHESMTLEDNLEITYETPGPEVEEIDAGIKKTITVYSNIHYKNILAYTEVPNVDPLGIKLYWFVNNTKEKVSFTYSDSNNDGNADEIQWIVPHLSNETYELDLQILNIQSYPEFGGNWTVNFTTNGTANLTIEAVNGTTFEDYKESTQNDLEFLDLSCGNLVLATNLTDGKLFYPDYSCNETGHETSKELSYGNHTLKFTFGDIIRYAFNDVVINQPTNQTNFLENNFNITLNITALDDNPATPLAVEIYGTNSSRATDLNDSNLLFIGNNTIFNGSTMTYNWTSPIVDNKDKSLVLLMHLDNRTKRNENNGTFFNDSSLYANHGYCLLAPCPYFNQTGKFGGMEEFNLSNSVITVRNSTTLENFPYTGFSISMWFTAFAFASETVTVKFIQKSDNASNGIILNYDSGPIGLRVVKATVVTQRVTNITLVANTSYHVVATWNGTNATLYLNGLERTTTGGSGPSLAAQNNLSIGGRFDNAGSFQGSIDEVAIWNRSLTKPEVMDLYRLKNDTYYWIANLSNGTGSSQLSSVQSFCIGDSGCVNSIPVLTSATINETNSTFFSANPSFNGTKFLNVTVILTDTDPGDKSNLSALVFVSKTKKYALTLDNIISRSAPYSFEIDSSAFGESWGKFQEVVIMFNGTNEGQNFQISPVNTTAITVNNSRPVSFIGNGTIFNNNATYSAGISSSFFDNDNVVSDLNHTNLVWNDTVKISLISISNGTHTITIIPTGEAGGIVQVNVTTLDNESVTTPYNTTEVFQINVTTTASLIARSNSPNQGENFTINVFNITLNSTIFTNEGNVLAEIRGDGHYEEFHPDDYDSPSKNVTMLLMHFDNKTVEASNLFKDSSRTSNNGTCISCPDYADLLPAYAVLNQSAYFNGGPFISVGDNETLDLYLNNSFTMEIWFKSYVSATEYNRTLFGKGLFDGISQVFYYLLRHDGGLNFLLAQSSTANNYTAIGTTGNVSADIWHHVAITYDKINLSLYLDGILNNSIPYSGGLNTNTGGISLQRELWIGSCQGAPNFCQPPPGTSLNSAYKGYLDEFRILNISLNPEQIRMDWDKGRLDLLYSSTVSNNTEINYNMTSQPLTVNNYTLLLAHFDGETSYLKELTTASRYVDSAFLRPGVCSSDFLGCPGQNTGKFGPGINLGGAASGNIWLNFTSGPEINTSSRNFSVVFWFTSTISAQNFTMVAKGGLYNVSSTYAGDTLGWGFHDNISNNGNNSVKFVVRNQSGTNITANTSLFTNSVNFDFIVGTVECNATRMNVSIYLNGVYKSSNDSAYGCYVEQEDNPLQLYASEVVLDEFALINKSLSASEILNMYRLPNGTYYWVVNVSTSSAGNSSQLRYFNVPFTNFAPVLSSASLNYTNITLNVTSEQVNASVSVSDSNLGDVIGATATLFVNDKSNLTLQATGFPSLGNLSIVFNATNITIGDRILVQFNATDGSSYSSYVNSSTITVNAPPSIIVNAPPNGTNFTEGQFNITLNITGIDSTIPTESLSVEIYGTNSSRATDLNESNLLFIGNGTNGTQFVYNWTSPITDTKDSNLLFLVHLDNLSSRNEQINSTFFNESSRFGSYGSCAGNCPDFNASGKFGGAYTFDGDLSNKVISFASPSQLQNLANMTISAWVKPYIFSGTQQMVSKGNTDVQEFFFEYGRTANRFEFFWGGSIFLTSNTNHNANEWLHVVAIRNGTTSAWQARIYVNGVLEGDTTTTVNPTGNVGFCIGRICGATAQSLNGTIDEVAIWNRSLSETEILNLYRLKNDTYYWVVNARTDSSSNLSTINTFYINKENEVPHTVINAPINGTNFIENNFNITLNFTARDDIQTTNLNVEIYGFNDTRKDYLNDSVMLFKGNSTVFNGSQVIYNWTSPVTVRDNHTILILHLNNQSVYGENENYFHDFSGRDNNLSCSGSTCPVYNTSGKFAWALQFDGSSNFINTSSLTNNNKQEETISLWVQPSTFTGDHKFISIGHGLAGSGNFLVIYQSGTSVVFGLDTGSYQTITVPNVLSANKWTHVVATHSVAASRAQLYIDGVNSGSMATYQDTSSNHNFIDIGRDSIDSNYFSGLLDEITIWNRSLLSDEILDLYRLKNGTYYWVVNISEGQRINFTSIQTFYISQNLKPAVDINFPPNGTNFTEGQFNITLNFTTRDDSKTIPLKIEVYGGNTTTLNDSLLLFTDNGTIFNGSQVIYNWTSPVIDNKDSSLVLLMHLNNLSSNNEFNGSFFNDSSRFINHGSCTGITTCPLFNNSGKFGGTYTFEISGTSNSVINLPTTGAFNVDNFTVSFWWKSGTNNNAWSGPIQNRVSGQKGFQVVSESGLNSAYYPHLVVWDGASEIKNFKAGSSINLPFSRYIHMVWTWNGSNATYTQDGVLQTVTNGVTAYNSAGIQIGKGYSFVNGEIDEVAIWNRTLSASEILNLYRLKNDTYYWVVNISDNFQRNHSLMANFCVGLCANIAPVLSSASLNYTNITLNVTSEQINASVSVSDLNLADVIGATATLFVNDKSNLTLQATGFPSLGNISIVFNATNITIGDRILVQFNATDGVAYSNYVNSSVITVNAPPSFTINFPLNGTNFTEGQFNITLNITGIDPTIPTEGLSVEIYGTNSSRATDLNESLLFVGNETIFNGSQVIYNWTAPLIDNKDSTLLFLVHLDNRTERNERINSTFFNESSRFGSYGSCAGNCPLFNASGKFGGAYTFDGALSNKVISFISPSQLQNLANMTISAWVKPYIFSGTQQMVSKGNTDVQEFFLEYGRTANRFEFFWGNSVFLTSNTNHNVNEWLHVVAIRNGTTGAWQARIFVNGVLEGDTTTAVNPTGNVGFCIGRICGATSQSLNGTIDEVAIWNRSLSTSEILDLYRLKNDTYYWKVKISDTNTGNITSLNNFCVGTCVNVAPTVANIKLTPDSANTTDQFNCSFTPTDRNAGDTLTATIKWYNSSTFYQSNSTTVTNGVLTSFNFTQALQEKGETWKCGVQISDGNLSSGESNSSSVTVVNSRPYTVIQNTPANLTVTTERNTNFSWITAGDADSVDKINYTLEILCIGGCSSDNRLLNSTTTSLNLTDDLDFFADDGYYYRWFVRSYDGYDYSFNSTHRTLNISVLVMISSDNSSVNFSLSAGQNDDTLDGSPRPIIIQNDGNSLINVNKTADQFLFQQAQSASEKFQFRAANASGEPNSFNTSSSQTSFVNVALTTQKVFGQLNFSNATDSGAIDINVTVPQDEPPGNRSNILTITGYYAGGLP